MKPLRKNAGGRKIKQHPYHPQPKPSSVQSAVGCAHQQSVSTATNECPKIDHRPSQKFSSARNESSSCDSGKQRPGCTWPAQSPAKAQHPSSRTCPQDEGKATMKALSTAFSIMRLPKRRRGNHEGAGHSIQHQETTQEETRQP